MRGLFSLLLAQNLIIMGMKYILAIACAVSLLSANKLVAQQQTKTITDCSVVYDVLVQDKADPQVLKTMEGATKTVYLRASKIRTDFVAAGFLRTTLYDAKSDSTVILRESGNNKFITYLDVNKAKEQHKKYEGIQFNNTREKKVILGYECIKTVATLADGSTFNIYYAPSIIPANPFEPQFKNIPGFVLEYESFTDDGKLKVKYAASKISLIPVPIAKFDIPKAGYRVL